MPRRGGCCGVQVLDGLAAEIPPESGLREGSQYFATDTDTLYQIVDGAWRAVSGGVADSSGLQKIVTWRGADDVTDLETYEMSMVAGRTAAEYAASVVTDTTNGGSSRRLRWTSANAGNGEIRLWKLVPGTEAVNSEMFSTFYGGPGGYTPGSNGGQQGHVHRAGINPATGREWGYIAWHDVVGGSPATINMGVWTHNGATPRGLVQLASDNDALTSVVEGGSKASGVMSFASAFGVLNVSGIPDLLHRNWLAGDALTISTGGLGGLPTSISTTVVAVSGQHNVLTAYGYSGPTLTGPVQVANDTRRGLPYHMRSRLIGNRLEVKIWPIHHPEPSWGNSNYVTGWTDSGNVGPTAAGRSGFEVAHLGTAGAWSEYGAFEFRNLDGVVS